MNQIKIDKEAVRATYQAMRSDECIYVLAMLHGTLGHSFLPATHLSHARYEKYGELNDIIYKLVEGNCRTLFEGEWNPPYDLEWDNPELRDECCKLAGIENPDADDAYARWCDYCEVECGRIIADILAAIDQYND